MKPRYDTEKQIYRDCKFCGGEGCLACSREADKAYKEAFPDGPKPIATFKRDSPSDMDRLEKAIGKDALDEAFALGGGGVEKVIRDLVKGQAQHDATKQK